MTAKTYLLDTNILIQAKNDYYRFSTFPSFWNALISEHNNEKLYSIDKIRDELLKFNDELSDWIDKILPRAFFRSVVDPDVIEEYKKMVRWVKSLDRLFDSAKSKFAEADNADAFLIAYAIAYDFVVVTHEEGRSTSKKVIKIPDVCAEYGVKCINTFDLLEELKVRF